jgi:hypothetical protein
MTCYETSYHRNIIQYGLARKEKIIFTNNANYLATTIYKTSKLYKKY